ncbi:MAG: hypothetical protein CM15mP74_33000 [Halieaceae bacterium]|nr:MAG: hypothetical protein CM15mP74_33000 [Halieaceae bacterium]
MIIASIIGRTRTTLSLLVLMVFVGLAARSAYLSPTTPTWTCRFSTSG